MTYKPLLLQMTTITSKLPGEPEGWKPVELHRMSILDRPRFIRALLPRLPWTKVAASAIYRIWDAQTSYDILLQYVTATGSCLVGRGRTMYDLGMILG